jgi:hypothetical protein
MKLASAMLLWTLFQAVVSVGPAYPPNASAGGNVVAVLHFASGSVAGIDILSGDAPFVAPVKAALNGWRLQSTVKKDVLVVVNFRTPTLHSVGAATKKMAEAKSWPGLAYPSTIVEPSYPANSLAEGSAILKLLLRQDGSVAKIQVVRGLGGMTDACIAAAQKWRFRPLRDRINAAISPEAYAIFVVRRPILAP